MVSKMPDIIKFKEPERCDYLYIDEHNKVHLLLPIVGGDEIGLDNTCQTAVELKTFFFGNTFHDEARHSAEQQLTDYKKQLEEDIQAIYSQKKISSHAFTEVLRGKIERLKQIEQYIELIKIVKEQYDPDNEIAILGRDPSPPLPSALTDLFKTSQNALAVCLSPNLPDLMTRFRNPIFRLRRNYEESDHPLTEGLGYRLRTTFFPADKIPSPINKKSRLEKLIDTVLAQANDPSYLKGADRVQKLETLKLLIQQELQKIDSNLSVMESRDKKPVTISYLETIIGVGIDDDLKDWVSAIITSTVEEEFWALNEPNDSASVFYDGAKEINVSNADSMSIRVQYLLAEANAYCKFNKLSDASFGEFFDKEPHASQIASNVKKGFGEGANIEAIIYEYINSNHAELGLSAPLSSAQQKAITQQFSRHYTTIQASPHFDEFFIAEPDKKGAIFSHQGRISCHFLDFFTRQTKGAHPLGALAGYSAELQSGASNRLNHKNDLVSQDYENIEKFKQQVVKLLAENKAKELVAYLAQTSPTGTPNYSLLSLETQNYISHNRNWPAIKSELKTSADIPESMQEDLLRLLSRKNVNHENLSAITWSKFSSKPLLEVELSKVAEGLTLTADIYEKKRGKEWWFKGSRNENRVNQCKELKDIAIEINTLLQNPALSRTEVLDTLIKSIIILDKIDAEISQEGNLFQSTLQREVRLFKAQLAGICQLQNYAFKSTKLGEIISLEMEEQFKKIINPEVQQIVRDLPSHCHTDEAIDFFITLTPVEAAKVASYLSLEYREINRSTNKQTLLDVDIPTLFKEVNMQLLSELKAESIISDELYDKLSSLADKIQPELFTSKNIDKWAADVGLLTEENLDKLLKADQPTSLAETSKDYRKSMMEITGREELPSGKTLSA